MNIGIIGTTAYRDNKMRVHIDKMREAGHQVRMPIFDSDGIRNEFELMTANKDMIKWADEIHVFWDGRSTGTLMDVAMAFALDKPIKIIYLEEMSCRGFLRQYADRG